MVVSGCGAGVGGRSAFSLVESSSLFGGVSTKDDVSVKLGAAE